MSSMRISILRPSLTQRGLGKRGPVLTTSLFPGPREAGFGWTETSETGWPQPLSLVASPLLGGVSPVTAGAITSLCVLTPLAADGWGPRPRQSLPQLLSRLIFLRSWVLQEPVLLPLSRNGLSSWRQRHPISGPLVSSLDSSVSVLSLNGSC